MAFSLFLLRKWGDMVMGKSSYHVNQSEGLAYSVKELKGYYNNLTEKITRFGRNDDDVPVTADDDGTERHFSIAIFQYGLAAYDLFLATKGDGYLSKMLNCAGWALAHQDDNGGWKAFEPQNPVHPYSSMAQGEGISLLVRCWKHTNDHKYLYAAEKAVGFLLKPRIEGGVCDRNENGLFLYEFTYKPLVLNGWIFSAWGLLDYYKATGDENIRNEWELSAKTIATALPQFDCGYWSKYNTDKNLASPFYHNLHIAQLKVMFELTGMEEFKSFVGRWEKYRGNPFFRKYAFLKKAVQKILE